MSKHRAGARPRQAGGLHRSADTSKSRVKRRSASVRLPILGALAIAGAIAGATNAAGGQTSELMAADGGAGARPNPSVSSLAATSAIASTDSPPRGASISRGYPRATDLGDERRLDAAVERRADALANLSQMASAQARSLEQNRWVLPLSSYRVTATFGEASYLWSSVHTGIDLAASTGAPISSVGAGVVSFAAYDGAYGNKVVVTHLDGTETWYAHMDSIVVAVGDEVRAGSLVGTVGSTGNVTGPHLHLEVRPGGGDPVDPAAAFAERGLGL